MSDGAPPGRASCTRLSAVSLDAGMLPLLGFSGLFFTWPLLRHRLLPGLARGPRRRSAYVLVTLAGFLAWFGWIGIGHRRHRLPHGRPGRDSGRSC